MCGIHIYLSFIVVRVRRERSPTTELSRLARDSRNGTIPCRVSDLWDCGGYNVRMAKWDSGSGGVTIRLVVTVETVYSVCLLSDEPWLNA